MANLNELDALYAFLVAAVVAAALTPLTMRLARSIGAVDAPRERGLSDRQTPLLGGLAIFAGALVAGLIWLPAGYGKEHELWHGVLLAAALITLVGALDDRFELPPAVKLGGQVAAAVIVVHFGVVVKVITLPFVGQLAFPHAGATNAGPALTVIGLVVMMNVVNLSDGVDGLAAGVCVIIAVTFAIIAFNLGRPAPGVLAALTAGAALGFLVHNFPPASSFMGDCGSNLLGLLMGVIAVEAAVKTAAVVSFVLPLILLAVPFLDTTFVVLKRLKYGQPIYRPDSEHFHHRMARIGFSSRRTIAYPVRLDSDARRPGAGAAIHPLQRPQRAPEHGLDAGRCGTRAGGGGRQRVSRVRARDPQVSPPGRDPPAPPAPGCLTRRDRAGRGQGPGDGRDRRRDAAGAPRRVRGAPRRSRAHRPGRGARRASGGRRPASG